MDTLLSDRALLHLTATGRGRREGTRTRRRRPLIRSTVRLIALLGAAAWLAPAASAQVALVPVGAPVAPAGTISEFPSPNFLDQTSSPSLVAPGGVGRLWFIDSGKQAIGQAAVTSDPTASAGSVLNEYPLKPSVSSPQLVGIAAGSGGQAWFTDNGNPSAVGRITPDGTITEFPIPNTNSTPEGITRGSDGAMWFADNGTPAAIGRVASDGTVTEYSYGLDLGALPAWVAPGPDGNVWFTDENPTNPAIGKITPTGTITEYPLNSPGTVGNFPLMIASGPDGNLWFTDQNSTTGGSSIGRISPSGAITLFSLPTGSLPDAITPGPDGNLWFSDQGAVLTAPLTVPGPAIGRITPTGTITEFPDTVGGARLQGITAGSDGNIWFIDGGTTDAIGRIATGLGPASQGAAVLDATGGTPGRLGRSQACTDSWSTWAGQPPSHNADPTDGYQWMLDGNPIPGATSATYTPASGDYGHVLSCAATVTYPLLGVADSVTTGPLGVIAGPPAALTLAVAPAAVPADGASTTTATARVTDAFGHALRGEPVTFTADDPAVGLSPVVDSGDGTYQVTVTSSAAPGTVTITAHDGSGLSAGQTLTQTLPAPLNLTRPAITGPATTGQTLTVTPGTWRFSPTTVTDAWQRCDTTGSSCAAIPGASGPSYVATADDTGHTLRVLETATNATDHTNALSAATPVVGVPATGGGAGGSGSGSGGSSGGGSGGTSGSGSGGTSGSGSGGTSGSGSGGPSGSGSGSGGSPGSSGSPAPETTRAAGQSAGFDVVSCTVPRPAALRAHRRPAPTAHCVVRFAASRPALSGASAVRLVRHGATYATGRAVTTSHGLQAVLVARQPLQKVTYTLTMTLRRGRHLVTQHYAVSLAN